MARKLRVEYDGAIYHVAIRGVERRRLFDDDADRGRFLERLWKYVGAMEVRVYLYCLMSNHVHLLVETPGANLGRWMHRLQTAYTVYYNRRHRRSGHLFQGRYTAVLVEGDEYLLKLSRYIHLNPVHVGSVKRLPLGERIRVLRRYAWSSYPAYLGKVKAAGEGLDEGPLLAMMGSGKQARRDYGRFVEAGLVETDEEWEALRKEATWGIGSDEFTARVQALYEEKVRACGRKEDVSFRRERGRCLSPEVIVGAVGETFGLDAGWEQRRRPNLMRAVAAAMLCKYGGLNQREAAGVVGVTTGAAVSCQLKRLHQALTTDRALAQRIDALEGRLGGLRQKVNQTTNLPFEG